MKQVRPGDGVGAMHAIAGLLSTAVAATVAVGCQRQPTVEERRGLPSSLCQETTSPAAYLPAGVLQSSDTPRPLREDYPTILAAMAEPSIFCGQATGAEVYRLARLEWAGVPLAVRVDLSKARGTVRIVELEAPSWNFPPGRVLEQRTDALGQEEQHELVDALARADIWNQPTIIRPHDTGIGEGTTWVFEMLVKGRYHVVSRWLPPADSPLLALGRTFLKLGRVMEAELKGDAPGVIMRPPRPQRGDPPPPPGG